MIPAAIGQGCGVCTEPDPGPIAADIAYPHRRPEINNLARVLQLTRLRQAKGSQPLGLSIAAMPAAIPAGPRLLTIGTSHVPPGNGMPGLEILRDFRGFRQWPGSIECQP